MRGGSSYYLYNIISYLESEINNYFCDYCDRCITGIVCLLFPGEQSLEQRHGQGHSGACGMPQGGGQIVKSEVLEKSASKSDGKPGIYL